MSDWETQTQQDLEMLDTYLDMASELGPRPARPKCVLPDVTRESFHLCSGFMASIPQLIDPSIARRRYGSHHRAGHNATLDQTVPETWETAVHRFFQQDTQPSASVSAEHSGVLNEREQNAADVTKQFLDTYAVDMDWSDETSDITWNVDEMPRASRQLAFGSQHQIDCVVPQGAVEGSSAGNSRFVPSFKRPEVPQRRPKQSTHKRKADVFDFFQFQQVPRSFLG